MACGSPNEPLDYVTAPVNSSISPKSTFPERARDGPIGFGSRLLVNPIDIRGLVEQRERTPDLRIAN